MVYKNLVAIKIELDLPLPDYRNILLLDGVAVFMLILVEVEAKTQNYEGALGGY